MIGGEKDGFLYGDPSSNESPEASCAAASPTASDGSDGSDGSRDTDSHDSITGPTVPSRLPVGGVVSRGILGHGDRVGDYTICEMLDRGGCGIVYSGMHRTSGEPAAVKVLRSELLSSSEMVERFVREARAIDRIRHPNIVRTLDGGTLTDGRPYLVMELLPGSSLRHIRKQRGAFSPEEVIEVLTPICAALEAVHAAGYIHRDLKSSNIIISDDGQRVTLLDFGIAKLMNPSASQSGLTSVGHPMGTPHSMAPEQIIGGPIAPSTDVYALGILTYELLTAQLPFMSEHRSEIERMHLRSQPPRPSRDAPVSPAVDAVVLRSLAKAQRDRYASPSSFIEALGLAIRSRASSTETDTGNAPCERNALGILVEIEPIVSPDSYDEIDDEILDALMDALDIAEGELDDAGFTIPVQTSNSLLGISLLPDDFDRASTDDAMNTARRLWRAIFEIHEIASALRVRVTVHADRVMVGDDDGAPSLTGPLLRFTEWPVARGPDVRATASIIAQADAVGSPSPPDP